MKKATLLTLAAFSLVGYQAFAAEEAETNETTVEVEAEASSETSLGFQVQFNEDSEDEASLA